MSTINLAMWSTAYQDKLPNSSFAWIDSKGGRHLPYKDANGVVDKAHVDNALARLDQVDGMPDDVKARVHTMLEGRSKAASTDMSRTYMVMGSEAPIETIDLANGKRFVKQVVKYGDYAEPGNRENGRMVLDKSWGDKVAENFKNKVIGRVPVPLGHPRSSDEMALLNRGEVENVESKSDGLYATLDIRDDETAKKIEDNLIWDDSVSFEEDYVDTKQGKHFGPTLKHIGLLVDPYIDGMGSFQALSNGVKAIVLSKSEDNHMATKKVANNRDFAVTVKVKEGDAEKEYTVEPGQEVEVSDEAAAGVEKQVSDAHAPKKDEPKKDGAKKEGDTTEEKLAAAEKENAKLRIDLARKDAKATFDKLKSEGKVLPAQEEMFLSMAEAGSTTVNLSNGQTESLSELLTKFLEAGPKRVDLSEKGRDGGDGNGGGDAPYDKLSDTQKEILEQSGLSPEDYNEAETGKSTKKKD